MFTVNSEIDKSEPLNHVLRVTVPQSNDKHKQFNKQTYSMSLKYVDQSQHAWCQQVVTVNMSDIIFHLENGVKKGLKNKGIDCLSVIDIQL